VAQRLHTIYGFSYDQLTVLLGGWHAWQQAGYPVEHGDPSLTPPTRPPQP
jgi:3-mercaptopyruvate sulfurtransferase SseA